METTYIDVPKKKWGVIVVYDYDFMDLDEMGAIMESFGMSEHDIKNLCASCRDMIQEWPYHEPICACRLFLLVERQGQVNFGTR